MSCVTACRPALTQNSVSAFPSAESVAQGVKQIPNGCICINGLVNILGPSTGTQEVSELMTVAARIPSFLIHEVPVRAA